jgi:hypothetical protein
MSHHLLCSQVPELIVYIVPHCYVKNKKGNFIVPELEEARAGTC